MKIKYNVWYFDCWVNDFIKIISKNNKKTFPYRIMYKNQFLTFKYNRVNEKYFKLAKIKEVYTSKQASLISKALREYYEKTN